MKDEMYFKDDLDNYCYHATSAISKSTLDMAATDLYAPMWAKACPQDSEKIKTFDFGDAMHAILLEPERLKSDFVALPDLNLRTNAGKKAKAEFIAENQGKAILTHDEHKKLHLMFESVMAYKPARDRIEAAGVAERSYFWKDSQTGLKCKCRPDKYIQDSGLLVDVKTTPELSKFSYSVEDHRYHVQDAWYCDGVSKFDGPVEMEFLVVQKTVSIGRYPVALVKLPPEIIEYGRAIYRENLNRYADFLSSEIEPETRELEIHQRFLDEAIYEITEVQI